MFLFAVVHRIRVVSLCLSKRDVHEIWVAINNYQKYNIIIILCLQRALSVQNNNYTGQAVTRRSDI